ncbi:hypothetical protein GGE67_000883 [Rhizobium leucaenae]|uniref:Uncharacterized protein n=1 Tax=Rhizobium leucaenae TaxID=29450 RepID=A0A7W7EK79_9HYPH|nr:hypothetical protein [Rhizobium leucaenae]MBB6300280.1 hypothetical protein [Rhizobium leucaenae]
MASFCIFAVGLVVSGVAGAVFVIGAVLLSVDGCCCAKAIGERTDAVAKIAPAAAEVNNLPVIVNLPFILMGLFTSSGGATPLADHHRAGSLRKMVE